MSAKKRAEKATAAPGVVGRCSECANFKPKAAPVEKKYELIPQSNGMNRVRALRDFGAVKRGDIGGYIENEDNLSHEGKCWVFGGAHVSGNARVSGDAYVSGNAWVSGNARVSEGDYT